LLTRRGREKVPVQVITVQNIAYSNLPESTGICGTWFGWCPQPHLGTPLLRIHTQYCTCTPCWDEDKVNIVIQTRSPPQHHHHLHAKTSDENTLHGRIASPQYHPPQCEYNSRRRGGVIKIPDSPAILVSTTRRRSQFHRHPVWSRHISSIGPGRLQRGEWDI
jgi:hypothetical protein